MKKWELNRDIFMTNSDQIKNKLNSVFNKYNFSEVQRADAIVDMIKLGESQVTSQLLASLDADQKDKFEQTIVSFVDSDDKAQKINGLMVEYFGNNNINEIRDSVYDKLILDYANHMGV